MVGELQSEGYSRFVAAGGDGTVNALVDSLMSGPSSDKPLRLGAIALGSSNDYHKPLRSDHCLDGVPCRVDFRSVQPRDVGVLWYESEPRRWACRHWIINASLGITAEANDLFNTPDKILSALKNRCTPAAILYAALRTIQRFRSDERWLKVSGRKARRVRVTNLGVVKSPHFSGRFSYDSAFDPCSGNFDVHLYESGSVRETLRMLWHLSRSQFSDLCGTQSWRTDRVVVAAKAPFGVEFDGEVVRTRKAVFTIADRRLEVCTR
jgi:diacylglycerol kinase family enzyme